MFFAVPDPGPVPLGERGHLLGHHTRQAGLVYPGTQEPVEGHTLQLVAVHPLGHRVDLVVHATAGVVVRRAVEGCDVVRDLKTAADLAEDLALKVFVGRCRLFRLQLRDVPAFRQGHQRPLADLQLCETIDLVHLGGRAVAMDERCEVGGRLGRCDHGLCVAPELAEQPQGRRNLWHATVLTRSSRPEPMHHCRSRHSLELQVINPVVTARVILQELVGDDVADLVELQAVNRVALDRDRLSH